MYRRLRPFKADKVAQKKQVLIEKRRKVFSGQFLAESSGIINWILSSSDEHVAKYIGEYKQNVPSFSQIFEDTKFLVDPISRWVKEETTSGDRSYVGYKTLNPRDLLQENSRKALFPAYFRWSVRNGFTPLNHINFTQNLLIAAPGTEKHRDKVGTFIRGIVLQKKIFDLDYQRGSSLFLEDENIPEKMLPPSSPPLLKIESSSYPFIPLSLKKKREGFTTEGDLRHHK